MVLSVSVADERAHRLAIATRRVSFKARRMLRARLDWLGPACLGVQVVVQEDRRRRVRERFSKSVSNSPQHTLIL